LVINGQPIKEPDAGWSHGQIVADMYDATGVSVVSECRISEIVYHFQYRCMPLPESPSNDLSAFMRIVSRGRDGVEVSFGLDLAMDIMDWDKPWSFRDFTSMVAGIVTDRNLPGFSFLQWGDDELSDWAFRLELQATEETLQQFLAHGLPIIKDVLEETDARLTAGVHKG
jgi:hypothetical protein